MSETDNTSYNKYREILKMLNFTNCIKDSNGDIWGYNKEIGEVYRVIIEKPPISIIPQNILLKFMVDLSKENKDIH